MGDDKCNFIGGFEIDIGDLPLMQERISFRYINAQLTGAFPDSLPWATLNVTSRSHPRPPFGCLLAADLRVTRDNFTA